MTRFERRFWSTGVHKLQHGQESVESGMREGVSRTEELPSACSACGSTRTRETPWTHMCCRSWGA